MKIKMTRIKKKITETMFGIGSLSFYFSSTGDITPHPPPPPTPTFPPKNILGSSITFASPKGVLSTLMIENH